MMPLMGVAGAIGMPNAASPTGLRRLVPAVMESPTKTIRRVAIVGGSTGLTNAPSLTRLSNVTTPPVAHSWSFMIVTVTACTAAEASANADQCIAPVYADCDACQAGNNTFACWCNAGANNIYGSGGCVAGTDCMWTLVSDAWNGVSGDAGYAGCMTAVPGVVDKDKPNLKSRCALSVEKIVLRGGGLNESLRWGHGSPHSCDVLTVPHRPNPSTPPPAASPARRASPPPLQPTTPWWRVSRGASNGAAR